MVPAIADKVAHVTMLQRSPTYFTVGRNKNELAETLRELDIDPAWTHEIVRRSILLFDGGDRQQLAAWGEVRTPSIADLFVAVMGGTEGQAGGEAQ